MPLELLMLPIATLIPAPYNPRKEVKASDPAYRKLKKSLTEFGFVEPLVWNETTGRVVGGHLRLRIAKDLGLAEVPVSVVRLTEDREKALNIVLNNQEAQGRYDPTKLADLLVELEDLPELELTGFGPETLAALRYEPEPWTLEPLGDRIEINLSTSPERFETLQPRLDELIREFELEVHVRRS